MKRLFTAVLLSGIILGSTPNVTGQVCGDANGDGRIDILDLSLAAGNFGRTTEELTAP